MDSEVARRLERLERICIERDDLIEQLRGENLVLSCALGQLAGRVAARMEPPLLAWTQIAEIIRMSAVSINDLKPSSHRAIGASKMADHLLTLADAAFEAALGSKIERGEI